MIDLQKLADMPGYGRAAKVLRAHGFWNECLTDEDRVNWIEEFDGRIFYNDFADDWTVKSGDGQNPYYQLRPAIDRAAIRKNEELYVAHLEVNKCN